MNDQDTGPNVPNPAQFAKSLETLRALRDTEAEAEASRVLVAEEAATARSILDIAKDWPDRSDDSAGTESYTAATAELTQRYAGEFPQEREGIEVLANLVSFMDMREQVADRTIPYEKREPLFKQLCEYQFLLTHFAINNAGDADFMKRFWAAARTITEKTGTDADFTRIRAGILPAVATFKVLEALGQSPGLSRPHEDAYRSIDLWFGKSSAVQVKNSRDDEAVVERTDSVEFPGVLVDSPEGSKHFSVNGEPDEVGKFGMKVESYGRYLGRHLEGYFIRIPSAQIDRNTGLPSPALIESLRAKIAGAEPPSEPQPVDLVA